MADNFSDKVVKKLQKQNLAVDLTEDVVVEAAPEEVTSQSQDFQTMTANSGDPGTSTNGKDIVIIPGVSATTQASTSQINFYWEKPTTQGTDNTDTFMRSTIYNYVEGASPNEEPVLAIGGYNGTHYAPSLTYGGGTGQTLARIWFHPFSGTIDAAKLVLEQTANTASIQFGTSTGVSQSTSTRGHLGWTGTRLVIGDGTTANSIAYTSDIAGAQNIYSTFSDGTNSASPATTSDTFKFRGSNGVQVTVTNNDPTHNDNLLISLSSVPNGALANPNVTIGSTTISLGATATTISGLTSIAATTFTGALSGNATTATTLQTARTIQGVSFDGSANITVVTNGTGVTVSGTQVSIGQEVATNSAVTFASVTANSVRVGNTSGTIDTSSGNLTLDSVGGTVTVNDNLTVAGTLTVNGTTTTVNATTVTIDDPVFTLGGDTAPASDDSKDRGIEFRWHNGTAAKIGFFGFNDDNQRFMFIPDATNTSEVFAGTLGNIEATTFFGALSGNATTATSLATSGTVALTGDITATGVTYTSGGNVSLTTAIAAGAIVDADINASAAISDTKLATITTANKVSLSALDIDGGTDIGAALADADLFIVDDGGAGTNRKASATRISDYVFGKVSGDITITSGGVASIAANSVALGTDTAGNYVASITAGSGIASSGATSGETIDHTISLKNAASLSNNTVPIWTTASTQFANSAIVDNATTIALGRASTITSSSALSSGTYLTITTHVTDNDSTSDYFIRGLNSSGTSKFSVDANGNLRATTKSFDIPHPTKEGMRLVYGVLEGPEHGVYHRGTVEGKDKLKVELPEYWHKLVGENYSVQLTSWGPYAVHLVEKTEHYFIIQLSSNFVMRKLKTIKVDYVVHGARLDAPLEIEQ